jgi:hypothetical protein
MLAETAIPGSVLWPLLLGSAVTLVSTLLAQWVSLSYQTRRQREARRADFQRTTLLQLRELLEELLKGIERVAVAQQEQAQRRRGRWNALSLRQPEVGAIRSLVIRIHLLSVAVEDEQLRLNVRSVADHAERAAYAQSENEAREEVDKMGDAFRQTIELLGNQLRRLA